jgi:tRNA nucleotidyltransferase (CCA-adding enzyme)
MKIFLVGGYIRDSLLGLDPKDKDFVVVGSSKEEMLNLGFQEVGNFFPVFLHPDNKCEYALARKEKKKSGNNPHSNFDFEIDNVSLEEDLKRRDLTINAMALSGEEFNICDSSKQIIDPYNGFKDLKNKTLRHVSEAFSEDPLRVLRVARFSAKLPDFRIAPETIDLMKEIVKEDEFKKLSQERILKEMIGAFNTPKPSNFFEVLKEVGGLEYYFPELHALIDVPQNPIYHPEGDCWVHTMLVLDKSSQFKSDIISYACLTHDLGKGITPREMWPRHIGHEESGIPLVSQFSDRLGVPSSYKQASLMVTKNHLRVHRIEQGNPSSIVRMFYEIDAFRKPELIEILARCCEADDLGKNRENINQGKILEEYFKQVKDVGFKDIRQDLKGEAIAHEIRALRVKRLKSYIRGKNEKEKEKE